MKLPANCIIPGILTLMYHRVDDMDTDPWDICVSPENFEQQIKYITDQFDVISVEEGIDKIQSGEVNGNNICITFDDGYADNFIHARPVLEKYNCPATFFIPTAFIETNESFWWDELELIFLHSKQLPKQLALTINSLPFYHTFNDTEITKAQRLWHTRWKWYQQPVTERCRVFLELWEKLRPLPFEVINSSVNEIKTWADLCQTSKSFRPTMNHAQLHELAQHQLFSLGIHTHTHIDLQGKPAQIQEEEIRLCKSILADRYKTFINCAAYPYGRYDDITQKVIKTLQLKACFTTEAGVINSNSNTVKLPRCQVPDVDADSLEDIIKRQM